MSDFPNTDSTIPSYLLQNGQLDMQLADEYENDDVTDDTTGTGTYDYITHLN